VVGAASVGAKSFDEVGAVGATAVSVTRNATVPPAPAVGVAVGRDGRPSVPAGDEAVVGAAAENTGTFDEVGATITTAVSVTGNATVSVAPAVGVAGGSGPAVPAGDSAVMGAAADSAARFGEVGAVGATAVSVARNATVPPAPAVGVAVGTRDGGPSVPAGDDAVMSTAFVGAATFDEVGAVVATAVSVTRNTTVPPAPAVGVAAARDGRPSVPSGDSAVVGAAAVAAARFGEVGATVTDGVTGDATVPPAPAVGVAASRASGPAVPASNPAVTAGNVTTTTAAIIKETTATASPLGRLRSCFLQVHSVGKTAGTNR